MPSKGMIEFCSELQEIFGADLLTEIFQGDVRLPSNGVCHGMVAAWIAAHLSASGGLGLAELERFRQLAGDLKEKHAEFQKIYDMLLPLDTELKRLVAEYDPIRQQAAALEAKINAGTATPAEQQTYNRLTAEMSDKVKGMRTMLELQKAAYSAGFAAYVSETKVPFSKLLADPNVAFGSAGFYNVGIGSKHAIGVFVPADNGSPCLVMDANTGEWSLPNRQALAAFLTMYAQTTYGSNFDAETCDLYLFPGTLAPGALKGSSSSSGLSHSASQQNARFGGAKARRKSAKFGPQGKNWC